MNIETRNPIDGLEAVGRAYRDARDGAAAEPPAALDDAIRAAARRAVKAGPAPVGKSWLRRWTPQLAVAATVVLTVSLVFDAIEERPELAPPPVAKVALHQEIATPAADTGRTAMAESAGATTRANRPKETQAAVTRGGSESLVAATKDAPQPPMPAARQAAEAPAALRKEKTEQPVAAVVPAPASVSPAAPPAYAPSASPVPLSAPRLTETPLQSQAANVAPPAARADAVRAEAFTPGAPTRPAVPLAAPAPAPALAPAATTAPGAPTGAVAAERSTAAKRAPEAADARAFADAPVADRARKADEELPEPWIKRMLEMRQQGKLKELREELARFNKRYPQAVLPKELKDLPAE